MNHRLIEFNQLAFWIGQVSENDFEVPGDHLKHRSLDLTKSHFELVKMPKMCQSDMGTNETLLSRQHPSHILGLSRG